MHAVLYTALAIFCLSLTPGSVIIATGQTIQTADAIRVLQEGARDGCPLMEEQEQVQNELSQVVNSAIAANIRYTCNGTPGWRRIAFINMTDTSYDCPTGLNLTSYSKRTCG